MFVINNIKIILYFSQFLGTAEKGEKKKRKLKKKSENDDGYLSDEVQSEVDQSYKNCSIWLNYKVNLINYFVF